ncbi:MAG TPA: hypothetical protein VE974_21370 [Thermoanaerobaculia bacterium]|nr:hypothetical protein [Thermoanaerobaculia bacterium]
MVRAIAFLPLLTLISCATMVSGKNESIQVRSSPAGATADLICSDGTTRAGVTPMTMVIPRKSGACSLTLRKDGHTAQTLALAPSINGKFWGNFATVPLVPLGIVGLNGLFYTEPDAQSRTWGAAALITAGAVWAIDYWTGAYREHEPSVIDVTLASETASIERP